jgi:deoxyadenosine/deoxycytidine kinase
MVKYFWAQGSGKTHLSKILEKKIKKIKLIEAKKNNNKKLLERFK